MNKRETELVNNAGPIVARLIATIAVRDEQANRARFGGAIDPALATMIDEDTRMLLAELIDYVGDDLDTDALRDALAEIRL